MKSSPAGLSVILLITLLLSACGAPAPAATPTQPPVSQIQPSATLPPSATAIIEPTATPEPSPTPLPAASPTPEGCQAPGRLEDQTIESQLLPEPFAVRVYLPPCYSAEGDPYPAIYMIHGQTFDFDQWDRLGMDEAADRLIGSGELPPFLIIMPQEKHTERDPQDSIYDQVMIEEVVPWVDSHYNTCAERECRAVGGLSRGATWAMHIGLMRPEVFGAIGAHSLTPFFNDVYKLKYWIMDKKVSDLPRFYLDIGDNDVFVPPATEFVNKMVELGIPAQLKKAPGKHEEAYWQAHVEDYLRWYAEAWK